MPSRTPNEANAIKALLKQAEELSKALGPDGEPVTIEHIGNAVAIILVLLAPIAMANYVTDEDLKKRLTLFRADCPVHSKWLESGGHGFSKFGWPSAWTVIALIASVTGIIIKFAG